MRAVRFLLLLATTVVVVDGHCEIYRGIGPLADLADMKGMFPGATLEKLTPAWAQDHDVLYQITGKGMSGTIVVKFYDGRPAWRRRAEEAEDPEQKAMLEEWANASEDTISVEWVRWIPDRAIPLQRFISKYGTPESKGFADEDLQPFRYWHARGLTAFLSDDEKFVVRVDFEFTVSERCEAWRLTGWIPPEMKKDCAPPAKPKTKPGVKK